jgi:hypothetical protein
MKLFFFEFDRYDLQMKFTIDNETLFRFFYKAREAYNQIPYHNWQHTCDVVQYIGYEIHIAHFDKMQSMPHQTDEPLLESFDGAESG